MSVEYVLEQIGLTEYAAVFSENHIDIELARNLCDADLKEIGIHSLGHRRRLLDAFSQTATVQRDRIEQRSVLIVFADLVGSTELTCNLDTEAAYALMSSVLGRIDSAVTALGGIVERHLGDAVMAVFGFPEARGDEAMRAAALAQKLHGTIAELGAEKGTTLYLRVGITFGQVVASLKTNQDVSVVGPSVNLASRLAAAAEPGQTLITEDVRLACSGALELGPAIEHQLKGFETPLRCWELKSVRTTAPSNLLGRASELRLIETILPDLESRAIGRLLTIRGEAGIGKSSLLAMWIAAAEAFGCRTHVFRILDFGSAQSSELRAQILQFVLSEATLDAAHQPWIDAMLTKPQTSEAQALVDATPVASRREREDGAFAAAVIAACQTVPIFLAFEDVHWADPAAIALIESISPLCNKVPLIIVTTMRLEGGRPEGQDAHSSTEAWEITLGPMTQSDCQLMVETILGDTSDQSEIIEKSCGHPLYLEQLLLHNSENRDTRLPLSISTLIQARVDLLDGYDRKAARAAAVLGQFVPESALRHLLGDPHYDPERLFKRRILRPGPDGYVFHHALIRDSIYQSLLPSEREALHLSAADWYAKRDLKLQAEHLAEINSPETAKAYLHAAESACSSGRHIDGARLAGLGLKQPADTEVRNRLLYVQANATLEGAGAEAALPLFAHASQTVGTDDTTTYLALEIGRITAMRMLDKMEDARTAVDTAEALARSTQNKRALSEVLYLKGGLLFPTGDLKASLAAHRESLDLGKLLKDPERIASALSGLGDAHYANGHMRSAMEVFEECLNLCAAHGLNRIRAANLFMRGTVRIYGLDYEGALSDALESAELARQVGHPRAEIVSRLTAGWVYAWTEQSEQAREQAERGLELAQASGAKRFVPFLKETLGQLDLSAGRQGAAVQTLRSALEDVRALNCETFIGPWVMGSLALAVGPGPERTALHKEAEDWLEKGSVGHNYFQFRRLAIEACLDEGEISEALRHAHALEDFTREEPAPWSEKIVDRIAGLVARRSM